MHVWRKRVKSNKKITNIKTAEIGQTTFIVNNKNIEVMEQIIQKPITNKTGRDMHNYCRYIYVIVFII